MPIQQNIYQPPSNQQPETSNHANQTKSFFQQNIYQPPSNQQQASSQSQAACDVTTARIGQNLEARRFSEFLTNIKQTSPVKKLLITKQ